MNIHMDCSQSMQFYYSGSPDKQVVETEPKRKKKNYHYGEREFILIYWLSNYGDWQV